MLLLHLLRLARARAARRARARLRLAPGRGAPARPRGTAALARLDRRMLADVGIDPGAIASLARDIGLDRLRRPPHV
jgi:hypothetical protein